MMYPLLPPGLHQTADRAKSYFAKYGATGFVCEMGVKFGSSDLPLKPTWQSSLKDGCRLCIEVQDSPIVSLTIQAFVAKCANSGAPVRLWIAVPDIPSGPEFTKQLKEARDFGIGVIQILEEGDPHVFNKPVALSLFAMRKTDPNSIEKSRRETIKNAQDDFLGGNPQDGCRKICEELESITRRFAHRSYGKRWWKAVAGEAQLKEKYFANDPWAKVLETLDARIIESKVRKKSSDFNRGLIVGARSHTNWRNSLSHKPKTMKDLAKRDGQLRTMFEVTRDLLLDWFKVAKALKLDA